MPRLCDFSPPSAVILVQCHCEAGAHTGCGNPSPIPSAPLPKGGWHGEVVTGGFFSAPYLLLRSVGAGFYPARSSAPLVTDAGRCGHRPLRNPIGSPSVGATLAVVHGRGRAPPLRTPRYASVGADAYIGPNQVFPHSPAGQTGPALQKHLVGWHPCVPPHTAPP